MPKQSNGTPGKKPPAPSLKARIGGKQREPKAKPRAGPRPAKAAAR